MAEDESVESGRQEADLGPERIRIEVSMDGGGVMEPRRRG